MFQTRFTLPVFCILSTTNYSMYTQDKVLNFPGKNPHYEDNMIFLWNSICKLMMFWRLNKTATKQYNKICQWDANAHPICTNTSKCSFSSLIAFASDKNLFWKFAIEFRPRNFWRLWGKTSLWTRLVAMLLQVAYR